MGLESQMSSIRIFGKRRFSSAFCKFFSRYPHLLRLCEVRRSRSLAELAESFNVDVETVLLALGYLKQEGLIKDVKFV